MLQYCNGTAWVAIGNRVADITDGLIAWYRLDDGTGTTAVDAASPAHNGTLTNGPAWATGFVGGALSFNGSNSYVNIPYVPAFDLTGDLTLSAWINATTTAGTRRIVTLPQDEAVGSEGFSIRLDAGSLQFWLASNSEPDSSLSTPYTSTGTWHHVAATVRGSMMKVYIDGVL